MTQDAGTSQRTGNIGTDFLQNIQLTYRLFLDPRVSTAAKVLLPLAALAYFIFPVDFLPDVVPFLGQLDDIAVLLVLMRLFIMLAPQEVVSAYRSGASQQSAGQGAGTNAQSSTGTREDNVVDADFRVVRDV